MSKVSVLTLTYNHEKYIAECINSILKQNIDVEVEILVGNDFSTDRTAEVLKDIKISPSNFSIRIFNYEENQGVAGNFCNLIKEATGEFIVFLDGDDFMLPGKLKAQLDILNRHPEVNLVHHNVCEVNEASFVTKEYKIKEGVSGSINELLKACQSGIQSCSMVVRNPYIPDWSVIVPKESKIVDLPFLLYSIGKGKIFYIKERLSAYRVINTSITRTTSVLAFEKNTRFHIRQIIGFEFVPRRYIHTSLSASYMRSAVAELSNKNFKPASSHIIKAFFLLPYPSKQLFKTFLGFVKAIIKLRG